MNANISTIIMYNKTARIRDFLLKPNRCGPMASFNSGISGKNMEKINYSDSLAI